MLGLKEMVDVDPKSKKYSARSLQINDAFVNYPAVKASFQSYGTDCFDGGVTATDLISNWCQRAERTYFWRSAPFDLKAG